MSQRERDSVPGARRQVDHVMQILFRRVKGAVTTSEDGMMLDWISTPVQSKTMSPNEHSSEIYTIE